MTTEMTLFTMGATYITKALVGRKRPYLYNTDMSVDERFGRAASSDNSASMSFFSGHTSAAFALATFSSTLFMDIHGKSIWSKVWWGTSLSLAAMTGVARVKAGVHYPTDVIAGAIVGSAIGYLVPRLHRRSADSPVSVSLGPNQVSLRLRF
jgi:membrane-associated phospholipid phosphatase